MLYQVISYFKFLLKSTNQHGVHSPFVYNLVTKCFYNTSYFKDYNKIIEHKKTLLNNYKKTPFISITKAKLLYRLVRYLKCETMLELGHSTGISKQAMQLANPVANITTLADGSFLNQIDNEKPSTFDLIFLNNNSQKKVTKSHFEYLLSATHNKTVIIFDGIYQSKVITEVWELVKNHPKITVSIDTFHWGIIFLRTEQQKEHFTIRI